MKDNKKVKCRGRWMTEAQVEAYRVTDRKYYLDNMERIKERSRVNYLKNKEKRAAQNKANYEANKHITLAAQKEYRKNMTQEERDEENRKRRIYFAERRKNEPSYRLVCNLRSRISAALKNAKTIKAENSMSLFGCSVDELKAHLESQFTEGMSWDNYGYYGWHVDHIKPCIRFNLLLDTEQKACFHYSNLQPLWAEDNLTKSDNYDIS